MIEPHGGNLVNKIVDNSGKEELLAAAEEMYHLKLSERDLVEAENIATGLYSPIEGFMSKEDYKSVVENMRLSDGTVWTIPVVLGVDAKDAENIKEGKRIALTDKSEQVYAVMDFEENYQYD